MIGGIDILIETDMDKSCLDLCIDVIKQEWPKPVIEHMYDLDCYEREMFIFKNREAEVAWEHVGADKTTHNSMIHLIYNKNLITFVIDERDVLMNGIVDKIKGLV